MTDETTKPHENLLASHGTTPETRLPEDPAAAELADHGRERFVEIVGQHPASSLCWALLAEGALNLAAPDGDVMAYAYARTGYHRGLDALRRAGWKGQGPVPWEHTPNQGFLRCLWALAVAADRLGEGDEAARCSQFVRDSSEAAYAELSAARPLGSEPAEAESEPTEAESEPTEAESEPTEAESESTEAQSAKD